MTSHLAHMPSVLLLLVAFLSEACGGEAVGPQTIELSLSTGKQEYFLGENITILMRITNTSDKEQRVALTSDVGQGKSDLLGLRIGEGADIRPMTSFVCMAADAIVLAPGSSVQLSYSWFYLPPGKHELKAAYSHRGGVTVDTLWRGAVESNAVVVRVKDEPLPLPSARAFQVYQSNLIRSLATMNLNTKVRVLAAMQRFMPLTKNLMSAMLKDPDPLVQATAVNALGRIADQDYCREVGWRYDRSLLPEVLALGETSKNVQVKGAVASALALSRNALEDTERARALRILTRYVGEPSPVMAAHAAVCMLKIDRRAAAKAIRQNVSEMTFRDPSFQQLVKQGLLRETGKADIQEAIKFLLEGEQDERKE